MNFMGGFDSFGNMPYMPGTSGGAQMGSLAGYATPAASTAQSAAAAAGTTSGNDGGGLFGNLLGGGSGAAPGGTADGLGSTLFGDTGALGGLANLGQLWMMFKGLGMAEEQFDFAKQAYNQNMANQLDMYNRTLQHKQAARSMDPHAAEFDAAGFDYKPIQHQPV